MAAEKLKAWSFSRWNQYEGCPQKTKFTAIMKLKEPSSPALERGTELHAMCEKYLKTGGRIPKELKPIAAQLKDLRARGAVAEAEFAFRKDWTSTRWNDWAEAWIRIKADAIVLPNIDDPTPTVEVHDFKTGKVREGASEYMLQLELYALAGLLMYPTAEQAKTSLIFVDHGVVIPHEKIFTQKDVKNLKKQWEMRSKKMLADTLFKPKPGNACRWCHFRKDNGGPCEF